MLLVSESNNLIFHSVETRISKKTKEPYSMVILRDVEKFDEFQFFKLDNLEMEPLQMGEPVLCEFEVSKHGFNIQLNLVRLMKLK